MTILTDEATHRAYAQKAERAKQRLHARFEAPGRTAEQIDTMIETYTRALLENNGYFDDIEGGATR
ncbi:hypothetical protein RMQ97_06250 [Maricaulis sp. D1M11]|uniref:hypothetical protein n=1 Tax=Maricaulis sp. D1M11 TaxID=3076117 RepID=UPI0039B3EE48